ncbi:MAG: IS66 family transposase [Alphaproteobacteria bacterium]|nr:IS66 family transposase [Alphaproteobacteria bacterium]
MASRQQAVQATPSLVEGPVGPWSVFPETPSSEACDWRSLAEGERARAEAAEARVEELRRAEVAARSRAGMLKWQFDASRNKLKAAGEEAKALRRTAKDALALQAEVRRLGKLLEAAGVEASKRSTMMSLRMEVTRLRTALQASKAAAGIPARPVVARPARAPEQPQARNDTIRSLRHELRHLRKAAREAETRQGTIRSLRHEVRDLRKAIKEAESHQGTIRSLSRTIEHLRARLRDFQDQRDTVRLLSWQVGTLRLDLDGLRALLKRAEDEKQALEARIAELQASRAVLQKTLFGSRSEQQEKPRSERRRGQQRGAGHGRTGRPALKERAEVHNPPEDACVCSSCGKPYVANGVHSSTVIEIEVQAHKRRIIRPRHRRGCDCPSSPLEVTAPAPARLFARTPYGTSVWARVLFERYACLRPLHRVSAWMADQGLPIPAGTLASSVHRFLPLFEPVANAILAHQNGAAVRHGDETAWRIQELRETGRSSRAWLWTSVSEDALYFHIDPSRSAAVAHKLFGHASGTLFLVCDRYSAYKTMARELGGAVILCWCWAHQRRDFIHCAAGQVELTTWCQGWIERIASIYRLNEARLKHYDPALKTQLQPFAAAQRTLEDEFHRLFAHAGQELDALPPGAPQAGPLRSLLRHRQGLSVFIRHPRVPMDNNTGERAIRNPVIGRRLSFGSDSETGARFTAVMYSVVGTLATNGIDVRRWLEAWLRACASIGRRPPRDLSPWLPWSMSPELARALRAPG